MYLDIAYLRTAVLFIVAIVTIETGIALQVSDPHGRLFPPEDLGLLEGPDRDAWQKPEQIMDALSISDGSNVADLGAGGGWFTVRLARRVGNNGIVYAEDIQPEMVETIQRRVQREGFSNVQVILGVSDDPRLEGKKLDAVLIVDTFREMDNPISLLRNAASAMAPSGQLGIVEFRKDGGGPGPPIEERVDPKDIILAAESAGLQLTRQETLLPYQHLLIFTASQPNVTTTSSQKQGTDQ